MHSNWSTYSAVNDSTSGFDTLDDLNKNRFLREEYNILKQEGMVPDSLLFNDYLVELDVNEYGHPLSHDTNSVILHSPDKLNHPNPEQLNEDVLMSKDKLQINEEIYKLGNNMIATHYKKKNRILLFRGLMLIK